MSDSQIHGKAFEDFIKSSHKFPGATDFSRGPTARFDIEAKFDRQHRLPTSVKSTKSETIPLSDARRVWQIDETHRLLVLRYQQSGADKCLSVIDEFIIDQTTMGRLRGDIDFAEVDDFHEGLRRFPAGQHENARRWAHAVAAGMAGRSLITLNPKIDSGTQRRLQCSLLRRHLLEIASIRNESIDPAGTSLSTYTEHCDRFGMARLPYMIFSPERRFRQD